MVDAVADQAANLLPEGFSDLAPFVADWALRHEADRANRRWTAHYEDSLRFYDAMLPRLEAALSYLDTWDFDALPPAQTHLLLLTLSLAEIANTVEVYKRPGVPNAFSTERYRPTVFPDRI